MSAAVFPVYQIDFSAVQAGKRVASSKRRIRWRFGFPNRQALDAGRTGTDCRGEENEIVIIWSIASGKRQILMDGREIHYSENRIGILDHSWSTKGNHVLKVVCHAAPPMTATPGFRQYDFFIDGQTFFYMPKVFELGIKQPGQRTPGRIDEYSTGAAEPSYSYPSAAQYSSGYAAGGGGGGDYGERSFGVKPPSVRPPRTPSEEEEDLQRAITASLAESKRHLGEQKDSIQQPSGTPTVDPAPQVDLMEAPTADLLGFDNSRSAHVPDPMTSINPYTGPPPTSYTAGQGYDSYGQQYTAPPNAYGGTYGGSSATLPPAYGASQASSIGTSSYLALPPSQSSPYGAPAPHPATSVGYGAPQTLAPVASYNNFSSPSSYASAPNSTTYNGGYADQYTIGQDDPFAPKPPTHKDISNDILKAYASSSYESPSAGRYQPGTSFANGYGSLEDGTNSGHQPDGENEVTLSMNRLTITESKQPKTALEAALSKLVNLDHIDEPAEEQLQLTLKKKEDEQTKKAEKKSKPKPPVAKGLVGSAATLSQIQEVKPAGPPKELVMKPPPGLFNGDAAMAGALVVHGGFSNPPPLQPRGVGIVHMQGQYPANQTMGVYNNVVAMQQPPPQQQQYPPQMHPPMMHQSGYGQPPQQQIPIQYQQHQGYGYR